MKKLLVIVAVLAIAMVACAKPPADVPSATIDTAPAKAQPAADKPHDDMMVEPDAESDEDVAASEEPKDKPAGDVRMIDTEASSFEWTGYGPGKEHVGTFQEYEGTLTYEGGELVSAKGTIKADSVKSDSGGLDNHLKTDDFFRVEEHPDIEIVSKSIKDGKVTADLSFIGVTHQVTFPATVTEDGISADFLLDLTPYGIKYAAINDEARIKFDFVAK